MNEFLGALESIATIIRFLEKLPQLLSYAKRLFTNLLAIAKRKNISSIKLPDGLLYVPPQQHTLQLCGSLQVAVLKQVA